MDELLSSLITNSSTYIGGRSLIPGSMIPSTSFGPLPSSSFPQSQNSATLSQNQLPPSQSQMQVAMTMSTPSSSVGYGMLGSSNSTSILRADMSHMISWLRSQNNSSQFAQSQGYGSGNLPNSSGSVGSGNRVDYAGENSRIPKPYIELTPNDCAGVVARAVRSIVLHTCNEEFRQEVFSKLGVSSSYDVETQIQARLTNMIAEAEHRQQSNENDETEVEDSQSN